MACLGWYSITSNPPGSSIIVTIPQPWSLGSPRMVESLASELGDGGIEVVAHERDLVADAGVGGRTLGRVHPDLGRRQGEDEPALAVVDVLPTEDVAHDGAHGVGLGGVEQGVYAGDRHERPSLHRGPPPAAASRFEP